MISTLDYSEELASLVIQVMDQQEESLLVKNVPASASLILSELASLALLELSGATLILGMQLLGE